jgi:hypothetical protein
MSKDWLEKLGVDVGGKSYESIQEEVLKRDELLKDIFGTGGGLVGKAKRAGMKAKSYGEAAVQGRLAAEEEFKEEEESGFRSFTNVTSAAFQKARQQGKGWLEATQIAEAAGRQAATTHLEARRAESLAMYEMSYEQKEEKRRSLEGMQSKAAREAQRREELASGVKTLPGEGSEIMKGLEAKADAILKRMPAPRGGRATKQPVRNQAAPKAK